MTQVTAGSPGMTILTSDPILEGFTINCKPSSNVEYFGTDRKGKRLFVQFKSGSSYIYTDVPEKILTWAENAESIGRFISAEVVNKYPHKKIEGNLINEFGG